MKTFEEKWTAWLDGQLSDRELAQFEALLPDKAAAEAEKTEAKKLGALLKRELGARALTNEEFFSHQLRERIARESAGESRKSGGRRIEGSRRRYLKAFAAGSLDSARDDGKISPISFAVPLLFSPAPGQGRGSADFFAPSPAGVETQIHFPRRSCFLPRAYSAALHQPSACPGLPAFANRFRIT